MRKIKKSERNKDIKRRRREGASYRELARIFRLSVSTVYGIINGWK